MKTLVLNYICEDDWNRPVFKDSEGNMFKDVNCGDGTLALCTVYGDLDAEPDTPIEHIEKYRDVKFEIVGMEEKPTPDEKFRYMMLSRLQGDCKYFLGNGNRNKKLLRDGDVQAHINEMKKLYTSFSDDKKPEWITWKDILNYEKELS